MSVSYVVPPLLVVEFLHRIMDIFTEYFSECTEQRIKEHYVTVYEVKLACIILCMYVSMYNVFVCTYICAYVHVFMYMCICVVVAGRDVGQWISVSH